MKKIHMIANAHLDPVWLWPWQEGFSEVMSTYKSAVDRLNDFPYLKFTAACASYYEWIEKTNPELFEQIKQKVKEGRWEIVGGWYIQPDCNTPSGESFARHALISQRYFNDKFGVIAKTGYNVDSFGHNQGLPKILKASGMDNYVFMRPGNHEKANVNNTFMWQSDDGSKVLTYKIPLCYCIGNCHLDKLQEIDEGIMPKDDSYMLFFGVGNHGGGPTIDLINNINQLKTDNMIYSTTSEYFDEVDKSKLQVINDDLQHHARGCYSTVTSVKKGNRKCENNLIAAEKFACMADELIGFEYPKKELELAWKNVLFNQFHDIMGGCSIKKAYDDASYLHGETMSITERIINDAMQRITLKIDTLLGHQMPPKRDFNALMWVHEILGTPLVVFNSNTTPFKGEVKIDGNVFSCQKVGKITDDKGNEIPYQKVHSACCLNTERPSYSFIADVPAFGYKVYNVFLSDEITEFKPDIEITQTSINNGIISVEFDKKTGDICKLVDLKNDKIIIDKPISAVVLDENKSDTWAHDVFYLGEDCGEFDSPEFTILESGCVKGTIRVKSYYKNSVLLRDYTVEADSDEVIVDVKVNFNERFRTLKFTFPHYDNKVTAKIAYGNIVREGVTGEEHCGDWFASGNLGVANDCKYGYDVKDGFVRMTILRTAAYADHCAIHDDLLDNMDMGVHEFRYSLFPYTTPSDAEVHSQKLNNGLRTLFTSFHDGPLPLCKSMCECDKDNIVITAIKKAEDNNDNVIRFYDANGIDTDVNIKLFDKTISSGVKHNQIKTILGDKEVNLLEW